MFASNPLSEITVTVGNLSFVYPWPPSKYLPQCLTGLFVKIEPKLVFTLSEVFEAIDTTVLVFEPIIILSPTISSV